MSRCTTTTSDFSGRDFRLDTDGSGNTIIRTKNDCSAYDGAGSNAPVAPATPFSVPANPSDDAIHIEKWDDLVRYWQYDADVPSWSVVFETTDAGLTTVATDGTIDGDGTGGSPLTVNVEAEQDRVGDMFTGNAEDGVTGVYNDPTGKIDLTNTDKGSDAVTAHEAAGDPHPQYLQDVVVADFDPSAVVTAAETIAANDNDTTIPTSAAVKAYADSILGANDAMVFIGVIDASTNPNYPAADAGHTYKISVAGKIGGAAGPNVEVGDMIICTVDSTAAGDDATVGANWTIIQVNIDGAVIGPASSVNTRIATFDGASGKLIQDGGSTIADVLARSNHTGTQLASTISDFDTEVSNNADVAANTSARHDPVTVTDSAEIDFTLVGQDITASLIAGSIDETKLDASTNASLDLADSAVQPGDNVSSLTNDANYVATDVDGNIEVPAVVYNQVVTGHGTQTGNFTLNVITSNQHRVVLSTAGSFTIDVTNYQIGAKYSLLISTSGISPTISFTFGGNTALTDWGANTFNAGTWQVTLEFVTATTAIVYRHGPFS